MIRHLATTTLATTRTAAAVAVALLALAACGSDPGISGPTPTTLPPTTVPPTTIAVELPTDPDAVVLQLDEGVNQPDPLAIVSGFPIFTLYADGRLIVEDRGVESGALPPLVVTRIDEAAVRDLVGLAIAHGAHDPLDSYGHVNVADADGLGIVVATADRRTEFGVYALGLESDATDEITPEQLAARRQLQQLRSLLLGWERRAEGHIVEAPQLFIGDTVLYVSQGGIDVDVPATLDGGAFYDTRVTEVYCVEVPVAESPGFVEAVIELDRFGHGFVFRQVLPHEPGCAIVSDL